MAEKVSFVYGQHSNLPSGANIVNGRFYVTTDTEKLYLGHEGALLPLGGGITTYANATEANADINDKLNGDLAYVTDIHALLAFDSDSNSWKQINSSVNNDHTAYIDVSTANSNVISNSNGITVTLTVNQKYKDLISGDDANLPTSLSGKDPLSFSFTLEPKDINAITPEAANVGLVAGEKDNSGQIAITTNGVGENATKAVKLAQGNRVTLSSSANVITITANDQTHSLTGADNKITLKDASGTAQGNISAAGASDSDLSVTITGNALTVNHTTNFTTPTTPTTQTNLTHGDNLPVVTGVTVSSRGHVTGYTITNYKMPPKDDTTYTNLSFITSGTNASKLSYQDQNGNTSYSNNTLQVNVDGSLQDLTVEIPISNMISNALSNLGPMVFKGNLTTNSGQYIQLPTSANTGDTYVVVADGDKWQESTSNVVSLKAKDMFVKSSTGWTYIPAGDDIEDTTYGLVAYANKEIHLKDKSGTTNGKVVLSNNSWIEIANSGSESARTYTFNHKTVTVNTTAVDGETPGASNTFTVLKNVTVDGAGHVTEAHPVTITMPAPYSPSTDSWDVTVSSASVNGKITAKDGNMGGNAIGSVTFVNGSAVTANVTKTSDSNATVKFNHNIISITNTDNNAVSLPAASSANKALSHSNIFRVVTGFTNDATGHINGITFTNFKLPSDNNTTYTLTDNSGTVEFKNNSGTVVSNITSSSLTLSHVGSATNNITIDLVWGTF